MRFLRALILLVLLVPAVAFAEDDPLARVHDLLSSGCHAEARDELVKVCEALHKKSDAPGEASAWFLLGACDLFTGDTDAARTELEESEVKFLAVDDPFAALLSIRALAELERQ